MNNMIQDLVTTLPTRFKSIYSTNTSMHIDILFQDMLFDTGTLISLQCSLYTNDLTKKIKKERV